MTTRATGLAAEAAVADWLNKRGFTIIEHNWRTRWCEIDLVAKSDNSLHIIEVKYRRHTLWYGSGFDYVTYDKAKRLRRAALAWAQIHGYEGNYQIDVAAVSGPIDNLTIDYLPSAITGD